MRYVRSLVYDVDDARDVAGETLLRAYDHFDELRNPDAFLYYLISIARREYLRMIRRRRLFLRVPHHEDLAIDCAAGPDILPDVAILHAAIARLPMRLRETLVLFEFSGLHLEEIRALQGGTLSGVKTRLARARKRLASMLRDETVSSMSPDVHPELTPQECES